MGTTDIWRQITLSCKELCCVLQDAQWRTFFLSIKDQKHHPIQL